MDREALERQYARAVLDASTAGQQYAALDRDAGADPRHVSRAAVALWRAESVKRELLLRLEECETLAARQAPIAA
jgi:hypothetical protein